MTGTVTKYDRHELNFEPHDVLTVKDFRVNVEAKITARNVTSGVSTNWTATAYTLVRVGSDLTSSERQALPDLADQPAKTVTDSLVDGSWKQTHVDINQVPTSRVFELPILPPDPAVNNRWTRHLQFGISFLELGMLKLVLACLLPPTVAIIPSIFRYQNFKITLCPVLSGFAGLLAIAVVGTPARIARAGFNQRARR